MKKFIPLKLRMHAKAPKAVKMPVRKVLKKDEDETSYYRETLMLMAQAATFQAENLLDHDISIHERLLVQNTKNNLDKMLDSVMDQLPEDYKDLHYDRMDFIVEMLKLATLIPPRYYEKMQAWMVERIESIHGIKGSKK